MAHPVRSFVHVGITVGDLDRSVRFWTETLGFDLLGSGEVGGAIQGRITGVPGGSARVAMVSGHGTTLELTEWTAPEDRTVMRPRPCDVGSVHLALAVEDIEAMAETCAGHGWRLRGSIETWPDGEFAGTRLVYLVNDDGLTLEFIQTADGSTGT